ncbi:hypothetical protein PM082_014552 [Marasmius tenuissimus]|nr:hypothetical protein PM082_014552 [Marasmius tenuissimus]
MIRSRRRYPGSGTPGQERPTSWRGDLKFDEKPNTTPVDVTATSSERPSLATRNPLSTLSQNSEFDASLQEKLRGRARMKSKKPGLRNVTRDEAALIRVEESSRTG